MRGKDALGGLVVVLNRITPAHAGKSFLKSIQAPLGGDHPRACGEKSQGRFVGERCVGSPPRMRGKAVGALFALEHGGITPAHAGKRLNKSLF